jgi:hypothetical protein
MNHEMLEEPARCQHGQSVLRRVAEHAQALGADDFGQHCQSGEQLEDFANAAPPGDGVAPQ